MSGACVSTVAAYCRHTGGNGARLAGRHTGLATPLSVTPMPRCAPFWGASPPRRWNLRFMKRESRTWPRRAEIRFNLSHSREMALLAVARDVEVGVDIERVRPLQEYAAIAERFFPQVPTLLKACGISSAVGHDSRRCSRRMERDSTAPAPRPPAIGASPKSMSAPGLPPRSWWKARSPP